MAKKNYKVSKVSKGGNKNTGAKTKKNSANNKSNPESRGIFRSLFPYAIIIVIVLMIVSFFVEDFGVIGNFIRDNILFGLFSQAAYLLPVILLVCVIVHFTNETNFKKKVRYILSSMIYLMLTSLFHLITCTDELIASVNPVKHYTLGVDESLGGGAVGGFFGGLFVKCFSKTGAFIIVIALLIALVFILIGITPKEIWCRISRKGKEIRDRMEAERLESELEEQRRIEVEQNRRGKEELGGRGRQEYIAAEGYGRDRRRTSKKYDVYVENEGERKTEFDPTITDEDFPMVKDEQLPIPPEDSLPDIVEATENIKAEADVSTPEDIDDEEYPVSVFDNPDDEELVKRLSKEYLGEKAVKIKEKDLTPTLENGEVVDIPSMENKLDKSDIGESAEPEKKKYIFPDINLLSVAKESATTDNKKELVEKETTLIKTLEKFNVKTESAGLPAMGPTITRYELRPMPGTRVRSIVNLSDDIALSLATSGIRIEAPIPGKSAVGIEVPNDVRQTVNLRTLLEDDEFINSKTKTTVALGKDVAGEPVFFDITKMPHLLIAGATGMGKSVCINCLIVSLLYKASPDEVKLILIDPKKVEFNMYSTLPHLLVPVVSDPKKAAGALSWAVNEMERRFSLIESAGVRNIFGYNEAAEIDEEREKLPHIVIIIDELADLMMTASDSVEDSICRLAQKARAAGMHLIIGTQRPSVDVITGTIKSNITSRIACTVASQIDSRTILDMVGAEKLIGMGDMLFSPVGFTKPIRVQGAFVSDDEVENIVAFISENNKVSASYSDDVMTQIESEAAKCVSKKQAGAASSVEIDEGEEDPKFWEAVEIAVNTGKISTSLLQRKCSVGFGRGAKLIDRMEELGFVSAPDGQKPRQVKITKEQLQQIKMGASAITDDEGSFDEEDSTED